MDESLNLSLFEVKNKAVLMLRQKLPDQSSHQYEYAIMAKKTEIPKSNINQY